MLQGEVYRYLLASSRVAFRRLDPDAATLAIETLQLADLPGAPLPHKPHIGQDRATESELAELRAIAGFTGH